MPDLVRIKTLVLLLLSNELWTWFHRLGGPGLILLGVLDNSVIPLPGSMDAAVILLSSHHREWWAYYGAMATVGAVVGALPTFRIGEKGEERTLERKIGKKRAEKLYRRFRKHGFGTIACGAVMPPPFPMAPLLVAAGAMHYPRKKFVLSLSLGRAIRFLGVAYLGHVYGKSILGWLSQYYHPLLYTLIGLGSLGGIGALVYFKWYRPKRQREERERGEAVESFPLPHHKNEAKEQRGEDQKKAS